MRFLVNITLLLIFSLGANAQLYSSFMPPVRCFEDSPPSGFGFSFMPFLTLSPEYAESRSDTCIQDGPPESPPDVTADIPLERRDAAEDAANTAKYFIALKDGWVYTSISYWVQTGTLHYVTPRGEHNQVSLDLVDRPACAKLNAGRADLLLPPVR